jgi:hypothetical protein
VVVIFGGWCKVTKRASMLRLNTFPQTPEQTLGTLAILALIGAAIYLFCRWLWACPLSPDPWGAELQQVVDKGEGASLCPHCLTPQEHDGWFCPECGSTTGQYGNYLPAVYIFSIGDVVRAGVERQTAWPAWMAVGYVLMSFAWLSVLAPLYCVFLFLNRLRIRNLQSQAGEPAA